MQTAKAKSSKKAFVPFSNPISEIHLVPLDLIDTAAQIRTEFPQESIEELAKDIEARGLLQPVLLNPAGGRFQLIAGERRLRAIRHNGAAAIPALLVKATPDEAMLMQLAENIQREELNIQDECQAIKKLYDTMGSLDKVANMVKKSKPWVSKRYAMTHTKLHYVACNLLSEGITEDIELLKALSALTTILGWTDGQMWAAKITKGTAGRDEIRAALKEAKEIAKEAKATAAKREEKVSHAKSNEPPPPPHWKLDNALEDISEALTYPLADKSAIELYNSWTPQHQDEFSHNLQAACCLGKTEEGFKTISKMIMTGTWNTAFLDVELAAMVWGYGGNDFDLLTFLAQLQIPREEP